MQEDERPVAAEFASWDSFRRFARSVRQDRRYLLGEDETAFLEAVRTTIRQRDVVLETGRIFYRAQRGIDTRVVLDRWGHPEDEEPAGYGRDRMKPRPRMATQGRANPAGIPVLYLGTTVENAVGEVRPWVGAPVSVAQFELRRTLRAIDLSLHHDKSPLGEIGLWRLFDRQPISAAEKERAVWVEIDNAFSHPLTASDDTADYAPTQILTELFRDLGYEAIIYKSHFGENGYNLAVFDLSAAEPVNCAPYEVTEVKLSCKQMGNSWYLADEALGDEEGAEHP